MSDFAPSAPAGPGLDPSKRVNYQVGLVLGEDEFKLDQHHHRERDHHATRALHGYGTVAGLAVTYDEPSGEIRVAPGLAVDAAGRLICVPVEYCADLNAWLTNSLDEALAECFTEVSPPPVPGPQELHVVLCYDECLTDEVPLPSESCLSAEDSKAASRIKESFQLKIVACRPDPVNELADGRIAAAVDAIWGVLDVSGGSPPDLTTVAEMVKEWAVADRPEVEAGDACLGGSDTCVPLATLTLDVAEAGNGDRSPDGDVDLDDSERPILLSTRFLQEALLRVAPADHLHELADLSDVDAEAPNNRDIIWFDAGTGDWELRPFSHDHRLGQLADVNLAGPPPTDGQVLTFDDGASEWVSADPTGAGGAEAHADLTDLGADDHDQYLPRSGARPMEGPLDVDGNPIVNVPPSTAPNQPIVEDQAAGGDLAGTYPDPTVAGIQGTAVDPTPPRPRDGLLFDGDQWTPGVPTLLPFATVRYLHTDRQRGALYEVWLHLDVGSLDGNTDDLTRGDFGVFAEVSGGGATVSIAEVGPLSVDLIQRNVFLVAVRPEATYLRFEFNLDQMAVRTRQGAGGRRVSIREWAERRGIWFFGQGIGASGEPVVTAYAVNETDAGIG